jgi:AraC-like DNA-binding protein
LVTRPPAVLEPFVERIWSWEGPADLRLPTLLPGTGSDFFVHYGAPFAVASVASLAVLPGAHLSCLRSRACQLVPTGPVGFVALRLRAGTLRRLGRMEELLDRFPSAREVLGVSEDWLSEAITSLPDFRSRADWLADFFTRELARRDVLAVGPDRVAEVLYYGAASEGVDSLAARVGLGRRQFERAARECCGMTPKKFRRICRLHHTVRSVLLRKEAVMDAAFDNGYYDQPHFVHEFRSLTGLCPSEFFTEDAYVSHFYNTKLLR